MKFSGLIDKYRDRVYIFCQLLILVTYENAPGFDVQVHQVQITMQDCEIVKN
jgi:hypothetical protein